jgi:anti-sigma regulatory factor (Ser/Thr protein kinase)
VRRRGGRPDLTVKSVVEAVTADGDRGDDVTLVLIRMPATPSETATVDLPSTHRSVPVVRQFAVETVDTWHCPDDGTGDAVELLTSELLTNAVRHGHGGGAVTLRLLCFHDRLTVEVTDHSSREPWVRRAGAGDESGRGLMLVEALAQAWGTRPTGAGRRCGSRWCRRGAEGGLRLPGDGSPRIGSACAGTPRSARLSLAASPSGRRHRCACRPRPPPAAAAGSRRPRRWRGR